MRKRFSITMAAFCGAALCALAPAQASPVNATVPIALFDVDMVDGTDLSNTTALSMDFGFTSSRGAGDFDQIRSVTMVVVNGPLYLYSALGGLDDTAFSFSVGDYGTFTETDAPYIVNSGMTAVSTSIEAYLLGTFSPAGTLDGFTSGPASFDVQFTHSVVPSYTSDAQVASTSGSGTLASPPAPYMPAGPPSQPVGEPASLLLLGPALIGMVIRNRRAPQLA